MVGKKEVYMMKMYFFEQKVNVFYEVRATTFLFKKHVSDEENSLQFYKSQFTLITFERSAMGLGIFTIQGLSIETRKARLYLKPIQIRKEM